MNTAAEWIWAFEFEPEREARREVLCGLANGYVGIRGAEPEHVADGTHYPGTYAAGCYNRLRDSVDGLPVETESLVNLPNPLALTIRAEDGGWLGGAGVELIESRHELDTRHGVLTRRARCRDRAGRTTTIVQRRFVHRVHRHAVGLRTIVVPENWSGTLTVRAGIDGRTTNSGVRRYQALSNAHYEVEQLSNPAPDTSLSVVETTQSRIRIALAARTRVAPGLEPVRSHPVVPVGAGQAATELSAAVTAGTAATFDTTAVVYTSRDPAVSEPALAATERIRGLPTFDDLCETHMRAWRQVWQRFRFRLSSERWRLTHAARLDLFHVLQTVTTHSADLDVGVPARGLHGEAYRGHVFWDELFVLRTRCLREPEVVRGVLRYRYRRLDRARRAARDVGQRGACYPWQSGSDGREENQRLHLNPASGRWIPDETALQRHIGLAVAYNVWQYWQASGDLQFLEQYGAEMILEIARYFASIADYHAGRGRYVIRGVVGPDEFHTRYPGAARPGIDNNAYTNIMTVWTMMRAQDALAVISDRRRSELRESLRLRSRELRRWEELSRRMFVPFHSDGVISQFEGYPELAELDLAALRARHGDIRRLDRILGSTGDDPNRYQVSKQADVLMLFYLLSADELRELLGRLGYSLPAHAVPRTIDYYLARTTHGSTLSAMVHAWVLARSRRAEAMEFFVRGLESDIGDVRGGTTGEGVHLGAMAGSIDTMERCFGGLETRDGMLWLNPYWPVSLGTLEFDIAFRGHLLRVRISGAGAKVTSLAGQTPVRIGCRREIRTVGPGQAVTFVGPLRRRA
ncbi:glycosyl hydrolase family 65 protein [Asanoa sp. NPDC049518]|uniref:glycoside hydrolase family 65 protein n=1 Tax=unclassified Asanoa TaxID=2685164 RepID=UPI00342A583E